MSKRKTERLLSLVVCLLSSAAVPDRGADPRRPCPATRSTFDAFKRMFERDKDELRELGIPLETGTTRRSTRRSGYRISRQAYELPEIRLEPDEAAVLGLAARVWRQAELAGAAAGALLKLRAAGIDAEETDPAGDRAAAADRRGRVRPALGGGQGPAAGHVRLPRGRAQRAAAAEPGAVGRGEPARPLVRGRATTGTGARSGCSGSAGSRAPVELHRAAGLGDRAGRHRRARDWSGDWDCAPAARQDRRAAGPGRGRRTGCAAGRRPGSPSRTRASGWDLVDGAVLRRRAGSPSYIASFGADVVVLEPADLREAVIRRLKGALA